MQILGAKKAFFRALKTKHATPKYGLIYHASLIGQEAPKFKGKISRSLAAKAALAIRCETEQEPMKIKDGTQEPSVSEKKEKKEKKKGKEKNAEDVDTVQEHENGFERKEKKKKRKVSGENGELNGDNDDANAGEKKTEKKASW